MVDNFLLADMYSLVHNCRGVLGVNFGSNFNFGKFLESLHTYVRGKSFIDYVMCHSRVRQG